MAQLKARILFRLGGGSYGDVFACVLDKESASMLNPTTIHMGQIYAIKLLRPDRTNDFPNLFLRNAMRELCGICSGNDAESAFEHKVPFCADVWFFQSSASPLLGTIDSAALVLKTFTCHCGLWFATGTLSPSDVTHFMIQMLQAVHSLHQRGMAHRDIKPANMLVDLSSGDVVLADFGFVSMLEQPLLHKPSMDVCTLDTRAPELCLDPLDDGTLPEVVTEKADVWSMGITLLCAILGKDSQPLGKVVHLEGDKEMQRAFLRQRFSGAFAPLGPDPGPVPTTFREWLARVLGATSNLADAAKTVADLKITLAQAFVLTQCLRLDPKQRPSTRDLLRAVSTNSPRKPNLERIASLLGVFAKRNERLRTSTQEAQLKGDIPVSVPFHVQHLLDGTEVSVGHHSPGFVSKPFVGLDARGRIDEGARKERVRTLNNLVILIRCAFSSSRKPRHVCHSDLLLMAVEFVDRLINPAVAARMRSMTETALASVLFKSRPLRESLSERASTGERRDLHVLALFLADLSLHLDGQSLRKLLFTAFPPSCFAFKPESSDEVCEAFWSVKAELFVQWSFEAMRSLKFSVGDGCMLQTLRQDGWHRHRPTMLGVFKSLELIPAQTLNLDEVAEHSSPLEWGLTGTDPTRRPFDVDF